MMRPIAWALLLTLLAAPAASAQSQLVAATLPTESQLERAGLTRQWNAVVPLADASEQVIRISKADNQLFAQTNQGIFYAFDAETGARQWSTRLGATSPFSLPVASNSSLVFVPNQDHLLGLDRRYGRIVFNVLLESVATSAPVADDELVMVGILGKKIAAYDIKKQRIVWNVASNEPVVSRGILTPRVVAFAAQDGQLFVIANQELRNTVLYRFEAGGAISASLGTLGTRTLLAASQDNNIYALDLYTGDQKWTFPTDGAIASDFLVSGDMIYALNRAGTLTAIDLNQFWAVKDPSGGIAGLFPSDQMQKAKEKAAELDEQQFRNFAVLPRAAWERRGVYGELLALTPKRIILRDSNGSAYIVGRGTGDELLSPVEMLNSAGLDLRPFKLSFTNEANDRVYMASPQGLIICLREINLVQPVPLRAKSEHPFGYVPELDGSGAAKSETPTPPEPDPSVPDAGSNP